MIKFRQKVFAKTLMVPKKVVSTPPNAPSVGQADRMRASMARTQQVQGWINIRHQDNLRKSMQNLSLKKAKFQLDAVKQHLKGVENAKEAVRLTKHAELVKNANQAKNVPLVKRPTHPVNLVPMK